MKRTNYQKEQATKRLALLTGNGGEHSFGRSGGSSGSSNSGNSGGSGASEASSGSTLIVGTPPTASRSIPAAANPHAAAPAIAAASARSLPSRQFAEQCLSPLLLRTLAPAAQPPLAAPGRGAASPGTSEPSRLATADNLEAWLFPEVTATLRPLLGTGSRSYRSAGVLRAPAAHPGQLFAAETSLAEAHGLEADICWNEAGSGFELKLFGNDSRELALRLQQIAGRLQADAARPIKLFASLSPGELLRRHLEAGQQEALAVIDAGSRWSSIGLLEQALCRSSALSGLRIRAQQSYCILTGSSAQVAEAEAVLSSLLQK
ncbi:hypothetical protein [Paenibacillus donghaensis]|uniref:Uncharacterized protein n=1 Tax=Paenibacillus donghaensis TaxID=414771 RepID=A0A2Z2KND0_9BACL|nr:hypothetical protein [Paenibacillus donghaensis]ASA24109.1 hypothetical protein B9T62_26985 [Paenibacillus donghaensis]